MDCGICHQSKHMYQYILNYLTYKNTAPKSKTHHQLWVESATQGILIPVISNWRFLFWESNISLKPHIGLCPSPRLFISFIVCSLSCPFVFFLLWLFVFYSSVCFFRPFILSFVFLSLFCLFFHLFARSLTRSFVGSFNFFLFIRLSVRSFIRLFVRLLIHSFVLSFVRSFHCLLVRLLVYLLVRSFVFVFYYLFVLSLIHSFMCLFARFSVCFLFVFVVISFVCLFDCLFFRLFVLLLCDCSFFSLVRFFVLLDFFRLFVCSIVYLLVWIAKNKASINWSVINVTANFIDHKLKITGI